ncbi:MAG: hypothetical protein RL595_118 [Planctomycetota bacterium]
MTRLLVAFLFLPLASIAHAAEKSSPDWWSFRPLQKATPPSIQNPWVRNPIDAFVLKKLQENELTPTVEASRQKLIRRVYFDLLGLPPTPADIDAFLADTRPEAYEHLVDRLLATPHYAQRYARHWLDVVHFGETHGYDKDKLRLNAWPYRDYVIRSLMQDKPYGRFIEEQLAGDLLHSGSPDSIEALGFIAAGPWDFIGHAEVPETKIDGRVARHLDRDDMVTNTANTFLSLTVQCAQCHNHKSDPVSQIDYYNMQSVFASLDRADKPYFADPVVHQRYAQLSETIRGLEKSLQELRTKSAGLRQVAEVESELAKLKPTNLEKKPEFGWHSAISANQNASQWVQVDLGSVRKFSKVLIHPCHDEFNNIGAGFGFPVRYVVEASNDPDFKTQVQLLSDQTSNDAKNPGLDAVTIATHAMDARYVRIRATKLAPRSNDFMFALAELEVLEESGKNIALGAAVSASSSIEAGPRWAKKNLTDGIWAIQGSDIATHKTNLLAKKAQLLATVVTAAERDSLKALETNLAKTRADIQSLGKPQVVYAGTIHHGTGAFAGTGPQGGKPRTIHVLKRGNVEKPGEPANPGAISAFTFAKASFPVANETTEGDRRAKLALWITNSDNPLTWRSIVNRVWRWHFGRGIVDTPNDFGRMGKTPSHPELLDWLAQDFLANGQSIKHLHRLILTSSTYRQDSSHDSQKAAKDSDNALLWRMNRRKLEAEGIRDSVLWCSGKLDETLFGPSFQDFVIEKPEHSPHYQYHLHDPNDTKAFRRAIYRFLVRSQQQPFMTTLDCADPSMQVDKRNESISSLQALALLNNGFMLVQCKEFAQRLEREFPAETRVRQAFKITMGREPGAEELSELQKFLTENSLADLARVLFNLNEFSFVD